MPRNIERSGDRGASGGPSRRMWAPMMHLLWHTPACSTCTRRLTSQFWGFDQYNVWVLDKPDSSQSQASCQAWHGIMIGATLWRGRYCLDGTAWTAPLVVLVICFGSILVFLSIVFLFVYIETRRATGQVRAESALVTPLRLRVSVCGWKLRGLWCRAVWFHGVTAPSMPATHMRRHCTAS